MIYAGFGFRSGADSNSLLEALNACEGRDVSVLATAEDKTQSAAIRGLAEALNLPVVGIPPEQLMAQDTLTRSDASLSARGSGSVAEAAALAAAGPNARLLGPREISSDGMATCALATTEAP